MTKEDTAPKKKQAVKKKTRAKAKPKAKAKAKAKPKAKPQANNLKANVNRTIVTAASTLAPIFVQAAPANSPLKTKEEKKAPSLAPKPKSVSDYTKCHIPKKVRTDVWNTFIGPNIPIHKCLCCLKTTICMTDFQVGHVVSEHDGGSLNIDNLRPICASCNISMGTINMKDYVVKFGYLI